MDLNVGAQEAESQHAGASSPHLDESEQGQAAAHTAPRALVIHEIVREEGETELARSAGALAWSGLAAGLSIGFSFVAQALLYAGLPDAPWRHLIDSAGTVSASSSSFSAASNCSRRTR